MTAAEPVGAAVVTPREMLDRIDRIGASVDRLSGIVDPALSDIRHDIADHETRIRMLEQKPEPPTDHEERIRALEKAQYRVAGFAAGAAALGSWLIPQLVQLVGG